MFWSELKWNWLKIYYNCHFFFNNQSEGFHFNQCIQCYFCHVLFSPFYTCQRFHIPSWLRSDTVLKWIDTFSNKHTYLKTSCIYLRIVLISTSLKFVGPLATRAKWTIIKRGQIIPCRYWVKQQIDMVIHMSVLIPSASPSTSSLANGFWSATLLTWPETLGERRWSF